MQQARWK